MNIEHPQFQHIGRRDVPPSFQHKSALQKVSFSKNLTKIIGKLPSTSSKSMPTGASKSFYMIFIYEIEVI